MSRDDVDRALTRVKSERERITSVLIELDGQQCYQLLKGASLTGGTKRRWDELSAQMIRLWQLFEAHGRVVGEAEELRARGSKPGQPQLAEMTRLLTGTSVEMTGEQIPLAERTLLGPTGEWLSLEAVVGRMTSLYEEVAGTIATIDAVWSELLARLREVEETAQNVEALLGSLGATDDEFDRITRRLADVTETVRTDPMSLERDGRADTGEMDEIGASLSALRQRLDDASRIRDEHDARARGIEAAIGLVRAAEQEAVRARENVLAKIDSPALPELPDTAAALGDRLAALGSLRAEGRWLDLAARVADLERAASTALDQAVRRPA